MLLAERRSLALYYKWRNYLLLTGSGLVHGLTINKKQIGIEPKIETDWDWLSSKSVLWSNIIIQLFKI